MMLILRNSKKLFCLNLLSIVYRTEKS